MGAEIFDLSSISRAGIKRVANKEQHFDGFVAALGAINALRGKSEREKQSSITDWHVAGLLSDDEMMVLWEFHGWRPRS